MFLAADFFCLHRLLCRIPTRQSRKHKARSLASDIEAAPSAAAGTPPDAAHSPPPPPPRQNDKPTEDNADDADDDDDDEDEDASPPPPPAQRARRNSTAILTRRPWSAREAKASRSIAEGKIVFSGGLLASALVLRSYQKMNKTAAPVLHIFITLIALFQMAMPILVRGRAGMPLIGDATGRDIFFFVIVSIARAGAFQALQMWIVTAVLVRGF